MFLFPCLSLAHPSCYLSHFTLVNLSLLILPPSLPSTPLKPPSSSTCLSVSSPQSCHKFPNRILVRDYGAPQPASPCQSLRRDRNQRGRPPKEGLNWKLLSMAAMLVDGEACLWRRFTSRPSAATTLPPIPPSHPNTPLSPPSPPITSHHPQHPPGALKGDLNVTSGFSFLLRLLLYCFLFIPPPPSPSPPPPPSPYDERLKFF